MTTRRVGVLAVQGAFIEHEQMLQRLGVECIELRQKQDLLNDFDGLVLPGGESTVQAKLLQELDMINALRQKIQDGMPTLATCAGLILLARKLQSPEQDNCEPKARLATMDITASRNAYGRQLGSFHTREEFNELGEIPMTFIRAPYIAQADNTVEILARVNNRIVAARQGNQIAVAFHPELDDNTAIHQMFLRL